MNKEIKEILEYLNKHKEGLKDKTYYPEDLLGCKDLLLLLDYITNLQEENERLKKELQQEKKDFKEANDYCFELKDYKSRNEKAAEFIKNNPLYEITYDYNMEDELEIQNVSDETASNKLLNILNGKE